MASLDASFGGLCSFACNYGHCPKKYCTTTEVALSVPPESLFDAPTCIGGSDAGDYDYNELCLFTCAHGFCPSAVCSCLDTGFLNWIAPNISTVPLVVRSIAGDDHGLCDFACARGVCPDYTCFVESDSDGDGELDGDGYGPLYDYIDEEYLSPGDPGRVTCDPATKPATLDDLINGIDAQTVPAMCWEQWALNILFSTLLSFNGQYASASDGYDSLYDAYEKYVKDSIDPALQNFMAVDTGEGNQYFDCTLTLGSHKYDPQGCQYLHLATEDQRWTVDYTLRDSAGFYSAVLDKLGIEQNWITFGKRELPFTCAAVDSDPQVGTGSRPCRKLTHTQTNFPMSVGNDKVTIANPKDLIEASQQNLTALADALMMAYLNLAVHVNEANAADIVTASAMPIFLMQQAIDNMKAIKTLGAEIVEENKKQLVLLILSVVLIVLPIVGEAGGELLGSIGWITRTALLVDVFGNLGLTAFDVVQHPDSAPYAILGLLVGGFGAGRTPEKRAFEEAANARKSLAPSDIAKFGDGFAANDGKIRKIVNTCRKY